MCGIAGRFNFTTHRPVEPSLVRGMCSYLIHRGPDDEGVVCRGAVGLGHRRLAIIDLSPGGHQPMATADERFWVTFNGEIYNYRELRRTLESQGVAFQTQSDTEVILHLYRRDGAACVDHMRGMFAFAIWDDVERTLFLARDRVGKKPLYYRLDRDGLSFASEPKAFLADPTFEARPHLPGIGAYLSYQYVPAPESGFEGVSKLPPAHHLTVRAGGSPRVQRYWRLSYEDKLPFTEEQAIEAVSTELETATRLRLISDVPLGVFLSGGIDSSVVVALMSKAGASPLRTFSIGFDESEFNELPYAAMVAGRYRTDHHPSIVRPDAVEVLPTLVWHYNEPYADSSAIPSYYLARETRRHVTVALNGDAGDENFAGYERYAGHQLASRLDAWPLGLRRTLARTATLVPSPSYFGRMHRARRFLEASADQPAQRYARWMTLLPESLRAELLTPDFARAAAPTTPSLADVYAQSAATDLVDKALDVDVQTYLPDDLLVKMDIATMAHSLEARSPFLDHKVMELVARLPATFKLKGLTTKHLLKRLAQPLLPPELLARPKRGFSVPLELWFRRELKELTHDVLLGPKANSRGYFRQDVVARVIAEHEQGRRLWHHVLFTLLMLELWHQMFIDVARPQAPSRPADSSAQTDMPRPA